jgi:predicted HAD superfamily phosphohydrolase YqeG
VSAVASAYECIWEAGDLLRRAGELSAKTIIFDVEPLVAPWNGSQESLDRGVTAVLDQVASAVPGLDAVCFATNSARRPSTVPVRAGLQVTYLALASKPFRTAPYQRLPRPGVVIGDQLATDGILARRLDYTFLHYCPPMADAPVGARLMRLCGRLIWPSLGRSQRSQARRNLGQAGSSGPSSRR